LRELAVLLAAAATDPADLVARNGGPEFCVVFADTEKSSAIERAERLRASIAAADFSGLHAHVFNVKVEDRGASIVRPSLDIDFSVAEMLPEYVGITTARAAARRAMLPRRQGRRPRVQTGRRVAGQPENRRRRSVASQSSHSVALALRRSEKTATERWFVDNAFHALEGPGATDPCHEPAQEAA
jgi:hypothetical protein